MRKLAICILVCAACTVAWGQDCTSKLRGIVEESGHVSKMISPCKAWMLTEVQSVPRGDGLTGVLLVGSAGDVVVVGIVIRTKANLKLSPDLAVKLLRLNHELDWVKVGIDHDGDLFVRQELHEESLTKDEFNASVMTVSTAGHKVYEELGE